jgi:hypothetical protein
MDEVWLLAEHCWASDPLKRPISEAICDEIHSILDTRKNFPPALPECQEICSSLEHPHDEQGRGHGQVPFSGFLDNSSLSSLPTGLQLQMIPYPDKGSMCSSPASDPQTSQDIYCEILSW